MKRSKQNDEVSYEKLLLYVTRMCIGSTNKILKYKTIPDGAHNAALVLKDRLDLAMNWLKQINNRTIVVCPTDKNSTQYSTILEINDREKVEIKGSGKSIEEAIGSIVRQNPEKFGVRIRYYTEAK